MVLMHLFRLQHVLFLCFVETLGLVTPDYYFYLNQSGAYKVDGLNDTKEFQDTVVGFLL